MTTAIAKIDFTKEQLAVIEKQFFPAGASQIEQQYCFSVARELGLNPITREIHFVPRRQKVGDKWVTKVEPMVGRDGFLSIAHRSGQLAGIETSVSIRDVPQLVNGAWEYRPDLVAECTVWRKDSDKPFTVQVAYSEYVQRNNEGQPTSFWNSKKITMISKVAESQTLRKAFNIHGVYSPEELDAGFETASGEFLPPVFEAEVCRPEPERGRLSVVPPPQPPPTPHPVVDDDDWPVGPGPADPTSPPPPGEDGVVREIIALLEGKRIPYEVNEEHGFISAKSYNHKELLKQSGFRWSPEIRAWVFPFEGEPF